MDPDGSAMSGILRTVIVVALLFTICDSQPAAGAGKEKRIVNGKESNLEDRKYQVSIQMNYGSRCVMSSSLLVKHQTDLSQDYVTCNIISDS